MTLTHPGHDHPLVLVDTRHNNITTLKNEDLCDACFGPTIDMPFYKCKYGCNFVLHEWCTRLPTELKSHTRDPRHTLLLVPKLHNKIPGVYNCQVCDHLCNGYAYRFKRCFYRVDIWCAMIPEKIAHKSHQRHQLLRFKEGLEDKDYCRMCLSGFTYPRGPFFSCKKCKFHMHAECALLLPETIRHKYDKHPMALSYLPIENHIGDYFCEVCEEEINPNGCFYHFHDCDQSIHSAYAPLVPQSKAFIHGLSVVRSEYPNIKFGSIHKTKHHPHPLSLLKWTSSGDCTDCGEPLSLWGGMILKCLECKYEIHYNCCS